MSVDRVCQSKVSLLRMFIVLGWLAVPWFAPNLLSAQIKAQPFVPGQVLPVQTKDSGQDSGQDSGDKSTENAIEEPTQKSNLADQERPRRKRRKKREFTKQGGVVYQNIDGEELKCDIYTPAGEGPFPAILAVHGGAWRQGSKFALLRHAWKMAQSGYIVVSINYRHAPQHPFPAQIHDCKHAIRWMKSRASEMKLDPDRIGAFGYSAGGHLVSLLGTADAEDGLEGDAAPELKKFDTRVLAVAAGGAPCEFSWIDGDSRVLKYWLGGSPNQKPDVYRDASPTTYVSADDPPFFIFHGESDLIVPVSSSQLFHETLEKSGVPTQHYVAKGAGHFSTFSDLMWMEKAIDFFDIHLKDQKDTSAGSKEEPSVKVNGAEDQPTEQPNNNAQR